MVTPVGNTSSLLLDAREAKLKHVEGQLQVLSVELRQVKLKMANQHEAHAHEAEGLQETEGRLQGEVAQF